MASRKWIVFAFLAVFTFMVEVRSSSVTQEEVIQLLQKSLTALKSCNYDCTPCSFDFEGGIGLWKRNGTAFNNQPTFGDNPTARGREPANQQGDWWIGGAEDRPSPDDPPGLLQGDDPQGTLTSASFLIVGRNISFLIGGSCYNSVAWAELIVNNQVVRIKVGDCSETMARKSWDVQDLIGKQARVRLVDESSGGWGHINFDDLRGDIICTPD